MPEPALLKELDGAVLGSALGDEVPTWNAEVAARVLALSAELDETLEFA